MKSDQAWDSLKIKSFLSGGISGCTARMSTAPMERIAILVQTNNQAYSGLSLPNMFIEVYKREGIKSFWKGNGTNLLRIFPFSAIELASFEIYKNLLKSIPNKELSYFLAGACSGMTAATAVYPLDLLRTIFAFQTSQNKYSGIFESWKMIIGQNGGLRLYRGLGATLMGIVPYTSLKLGSFQILKNITIGQTFLSTDAMNFINGALAGCIAITLTYPTDMLRKRLQVQLFDEKSEKIGYVQLVKNILQKDGFRGLYRGLMATYLKFIPLTAITLSLNEKIKRNWL